MTVITRIQQGQQLWTTSLLHAKTGEPVLYPPDHRKAGEPATFHILATSVDSARYAARKHATRAGFDHTSSAYKWTEPEVVFGEIIVA